VEDNDIAQRVDQLVTLVDRASQDVLDELNALITDIVERIGQAEASENYARVGSLATFCGQAYRNVADTCDRGQTSTLLIASSLLVASSYWELRATCAEMDNDIVHQVGVERPKFERLADADDPEYDPEASRQRELMRKLRNAGRKLAAAERPGTVTDVAPPTKLTDASVASTAVAGPADRVTEMARTDAKRSSVSDLGSSPSSTPDQGVRNASASDGGATIGRGTVHSV
jgi:hypothetical protein